MEDYSYVMFIGIINITYERLFVTSQAGYGQVSEYFPP